MKLSIRYNPKPPIMSGLLSPSIFKADLLISGFREELIKLADREKVTRKGVKE